MAKKYDLAVKVGEYEKDGETKSKWQNVGVVLEGEHGPYILLDRVFNPAGLPNPENRNNIFVSMFKPKGKKDDAEPSADQEDDDI